MKENWYLNLSELIAKQSTCLSKKWGAVIINNDKLISIGFNASPKNIKSCEICNLQEYRRKNNLCRGTGYEQCLSVHAEVNAILNADRKMLVGSDLYLCGTENGEYVKKPMPCTNCRKIIINAGIKKVIVRIDKEYYITLNVDEWNKSDVIGGY